MDKGSSVREGDARTGRRGHRDLEVHDDPAFHRRVWRFQRAGRVAMLLVVLAGFAGLLGSGPLSHTVAGELPRSLRVEYERFARADSPQKMTIRIPAAAHSGGVYRLAVSREFVDRINVDGVVPPPLFAEATPDDLVYVFAGHPTGAVATIHFTPRTMGLLSACWSAPGLSPTAVRVLVYP